MLSILHRSLFPLLVLLVFLSVNRALGETHQDASPVSAEASSVTVSGNWGLSFPQEGQPPVGNATREDLAQYDAYFMGDPAKKVLYLTFDCGYENGQTEKILNALKKHHAPAAFFVVGNMIETAPEIVRRMADEGHIVGNHTFHHPDMSAISDQAAFQKELDDLAALYEKTTGKPLPRFYRPPQGKYSAENLRQAQALGYRTILWSLAYVDWYTEDQPTPGSLRQAAAPYSQRCHRSAALHLPYQRRHSGRASDKMGTYGIFLRFPGTAPLNKGAERFSALPFGAFHRKSVSPLPFSRSFCYNLF